MVHVLLSMDRPVGSAGETVHVAPVTLVMPPPEPLPELLPEPLPELLPEPLPEPLPITREVSNEYDVDTAVGDERYVVVPSPSCPSEL